MNFFLQANFYDKAAGLRKMSEDTGQTSNVVLIGIAIVAVFGVMAWYFSRARRYTGPERRGAPQGIISNAKSAATDVGISYEPNAPSLSSWAGVNGLRLMFNLDGHRVQRLIRAQKSGASLVVQGMNLEHLEETQGRLAVVDQESVLFYDVLIQPGTTKGALVLEPQANASAVRIATAARTPAQGIAKLITAAGEIEAQMNDIGVEGIGILMNSIIAVGTVTDVAFTIPGTATEIRAQGRVAWAKPNAAGACRAGIQLSGHDDAARANLADFVLHSRTQHA